MYQIYTFKSCKKVIYFLQLMTSFIGTKKSELTIHKQILQIKLTLQLKYYNETRIDSIGKLLWLQPCIYERTT